MLYAMLALAALPISKGSFDDCVVGAQRAIAGDWTTTTLRRGGATIAPTVQSGRSKGAWIEPYTLVIRSESKGTVRTIRETLVKAGLDLVVDGKPVGVWPIDWKCAHDPKSGTYSLEMRYLRPTKNGKKPFFNLIEASAKGYVLERHRVRSDGSLEWDSTEVGVARNPSAGR